MYIVCWIKMHIFFFHFADNIGEIMWLAFDINKWPKKLILLFGAQHHITLIRMAKVNAAVNITKDDQSKITGWKRILCISILICGMFFNGIVYGLPSPSILSFQKDLKNTTEFDHLLPKYVIILMNHGLLN